MAKSPTLQKVRDFFAPQHQPERRRPTISLPTINPNYLPLHEAAHQDMPAVDAQARAQAQALSDAFMDTLVLGNSEQDPQRQPGLRRMATVQSADDSQFVSWRRMPTPAHPEPPGHARKVSKGENLRVFALNNLWRSMAHNRWLSGDFFSFPIPTMPATQPVPEDVHRAIPPSAVLRRYNSSPDLYALTRQDELRG